MAAGNCPGYFFNVSSVCASQTIQKGAYIIMETKIYDASTIDEAADLLQAGQLIAFPTETVYGLGAIASNDEAVKNVYKVKGRPSDNPLIVHVCDREVGQYVAFVPQQAEALMEAFWPGPLTLIFPMKEGVFAPTVTAGHNTVALRMPAQEQTLELIRKTGFPLVGPSANTSGKPSPTTAQHVMHDLSGKIAGILDGGETQIGLESTVLDLTNADGPVILRPGAITEVQLEPIIGKMAGSAQTTNESEAPKAPGMKYQHYAPAQPVVLIDGTDADWEAAIDEYCGKGKKIGILASEEKLAIHQQAARSTYSLGMKNDVVAASQRLYAGLRYLDEQPVDVILAEAYDLAGLGKAFMNRLEKAASSKYPKKEAK
jgi:L-threonylcarbamoyladenylate synthase